MTEDFQKRLFARNLAYYVNLSGKYDALRANRPARDADWTYISKDSLLQIGYTVMDSLNGGYGVSNVEGGVEFWFELEEA